MFFLKKLVTHIVLPPGIFIFLFFMGGFSILKRRHKIGYIFLAGGLCFYLLSTGIISNALIIPLENAYAFNPDATGDLIVILGGGIKRDVPDLFGKGFPTEETLARLFAACRLWSG